MLSARSALHIRLVNSLRLLWLLILIWYEFGTFLYHALSCNWPDTIESPATHVLLLADPQILDMRSYPGRHPLAMVLTRLLVDVNMRKSWRATARLKPDVIVFLGDMMDGGRSAIPSREYEQYFERFRSIFSMTAKVPVYYLPGNHDVGLGSSPKFSDEALFRYMTHFGPLSQRFEAGNFTFMLTDAPGLVNEDRQRAQSGLDFARWAPSTSSGPSRFLTDFAASRGTKPVVLLSHIPLTRPEGSSCGPLREKGIIRQGHGLGYQNTLTPEASWFLLETTRPSIIFSGDDHDYCEFDHKNPQQDLPPIREVSVKSFSMAMGVRRPGFQLLSLASSPQPRVADTPCFLPDQLGIYLYVYVPLIIVSLAALVVSNVYRITRRHSSWTTSPPRGPLTRLDSDSTSTARRPHRALSMSTRERAEPLPSRSTGPTELLELPGAGSPRSRHKSSAQPWRRRAATVGTWILQDPSADATRQRAGFLRGLGADVVDVAWLAVVAFAGINCWAFW